ncbi:Vacuolar protein sorting-associated protein 33A [Thelohanellus kitauei]|uniref:Vacuolar protein sorting-associated protein 33A n=1 Tax=Thelohanellus kitauei TaxID=669202 RepID=A0A0C2MPK4_THEKT|nr:Vacuolar protein sorting-associated protein 33A [Thelohanellus kitauei]
MTVDFTVFRELFTNKIIECLNKCFGRKILIFDKNLTSLNLVSTYQVFEKNHIEKIYYLEENSAPTLIGIEHVLFFCGPSTANVPIISKIINGIREKFLKMRFSLFVIPSINTLFMKKLGENLIDEAFVVMESLPIYLYPIDNDLISLENSESYFDYLLEGDISVVNDVVNSIVTIESVFGSPPVIKGKGSISKRVVDILTSQKNPNDGERSSFDSQINTLIIIDRNCDLLTPLLSELTYEGLIRSIFPVSACKITLSKHVNNEQETRTLMLNSSNEYYVSLRYLLYSESVSRIRDSATKFKQEFDNFMKTKNVTDLQKAVSNYPVLRQKKNDIEMNADISERISKIVNQNLFENIIMLEREMVIDHSFDQVPQMIDRLTGQLRTAKDVVRLMSIHSIMRGGLNEKMYEYYSYALFQAYGYMTINFILNFEKMGLIKYSQESGKGKNFMDLSKSMKLLDSRAHIKFYECYFPLSCKLISYFIHDSLPNVAPRVLNDTIKSIPGEMFMTNRQTCNTFAPKSQQNFAKASTILVFFIGGCTSSEVALLRSLSQQEGSSYEILIATTSILSSDTIINYAFKK